MGINIGTGLLSLLLPCMYSPMWYQVYRPVPVLQPSFGFWMPAAPGWSGCKLFLPIFFFKEVDLGQGVRLLLALAGLSSASRLEDVVAGGTVVLVRRCSRGSVEVRLVALAILHDLEQLGHSMSGALQHPTSLPSLLQRGRCRCDQLTMSLMSYLPTSHCATDNGSLI